jgi:hypothetical protein
MTSVLVQLMKLSLSQESVMKIRKLWLRKVLVTGERWPQCGVYQKKLFHEIMKKAE